MGRGGRAAKGTDGRWCEETAVAFNSGSREGAGAAVGCDAAAAALLIVSAATPVLLGGLHCCSCCSEGLLKLPKLP